MNQHTRAKIKLRYYVTIGFLLCAIQLFSLKFLTLDHWQVIDDLVIAFLLYQAVANKILQPGNRKMFHYPMLMLMLIPFLSAFSAYVFHDQTVVESMLAARPCLLLLFYFYIKRNGMEVEKVENLLLWFGVIVAFIITVQAFTFPRVLFEQASQNEDYADREGVSRIFIHDPTYTVFAVFLLAHRLIERMRLKDAILFGICLAGIVFTATRQVIFASLGCLLFYFLYSLDFRSKKAIRALSILVVFAGLFLVAGGARYINKLITLTSEQQVTDKDYARVVETTFYLFTYYPSDMAYVIGNGMQYGKSKYGAEINKIEGEGLFRSDIGLIGALNMFGIVYLIPIFIIYYRVAKARLKGKMYYKFIFLYLVLTSLTGNNYYVMPWTYTLIGLMLYNIETINRENKAKALMNQRVVG